MMYAVNKLTKEHLICGMSIKRPDNQRYFVEADDDGWIEWHGGECPLPKNALVEVKHRDGDIYREPCGFRRSENWSHIDLGSDIIAYRPVLDDEPQEPDDCVTVRYDLDPVGVEGAIRDKLIEMGWTPPKIDREKWIEAAEPLLRVGNTETVLGNIYDALKSGDLPQP